MRNIFAYLRCKRHFYIADDRSAWIASTINQETDKAILLHPNGRLFSPHPRAFPGASSMWLEISKDDIRYWRGAYYCCAGHYYGKVWWK